MSKEASSTGEDVEIRSCVHSEDATNDMGDGSVPKDASDQDFGPKKKSTAEFNREDEVTCMITGTSLHYKMFVKTMVTDRDGKKLKPEFNGSYCYLCNLYVPKGLGDEKNEHCRTSGHKNAATKYALDELVKRGHHHCHCICCRKCIKWDDFNKKVHDHLMSDEHLTYAVEKILILKSISSREEHTEDSASGQKSDQPESKLHDLLTVYNEETWLPTCNFIGESKASKSFCYICEYKPLQMATEDVDNHIVGKCHQAALKKYGCEKILACGHKFFDCLWCGTKLNSLTKLKTHVLDEQHMSRVMEARGRNKRDETIEPKTEAPHLDLGASQESGSPKNEPEDEKPGTGSGNEMSLLPTVKFIVTRNKKQSFCQICDDNPLLIATLDIDSHVAQKLHQDALKKYGCENILTSGDDFFKCAWCDRDMFSIEDIFLHIKGKRHTSQVVEVRAKEKKAKNVPRITCMLTAPSKIYSKFVETIVKDRDGNKLDPEFKGAYCYICNLYIPNHEFNEIEEHYQSLEHVNAETECSHNELKEKTKKHWHCMCCKVCIQGPNYHVDMYNHLMNGDHLARLAEKEKFLQSTNINKSCSKDFDSSQKTRQTKSKLDTKNSKLHEFGAYDEESWLSPYDFIDKPNPEETVCHICEDTPLRLNNEEVDSHVSQARHQAALRKYGCEDILTCGNKFFKCLWCNVETLDLKNVGSHARDGNHMSHVMEARAKEDDEICYPSEETPATSREASTTRMKQRNYRSENISENTQTGDTIDYLSSKEASRQDSDGNEKSVPLEKDHVTDKTHRSQMATPEIGAKDKEEETCYSSKESLEISRRASMVEEEQGIGSSDNISENAKKAKYVPQITSVFTAPSALYSKFVESIVKDRDGNKLDPDFIGAYCYICNLYIPNHKVDEIEQHYNTVEHKNAETKCGHNELKEKTKKHWHCICCRVCIQGLNYDVDMYKHLMNGDHLARLAEKEKFLQSTNIEESCSENFLVSQKSDRTTSQLHTKNSKMHKFGAYDEESWLSPYDFIYKPNPKETVCHICEDTPFRLNNEDMDSHVSQERHQAALRKYGCENILTCGNKFFKCLWCNVETLHLKSVRNHARDENHMSRVMEARAKEDEEICYPSEETPATSREASTTRTKQGNYSSKNISENTQTGHTMDYLSSKEASRQDSDGNEKSVPLENDYVTGKTYRGWMVAPEIGPKDKKEETCYSSKESLEISRRASMTGERHGIGSSDNISENGKTAKHVPQILSVVTAPSKLYSKFVETFGTDRYGNKLNPKFIGAYCYICNLYVPNCKVSKMEHHYNTLKHKKAEMKCGCNELKEKAKKHWHCMCCRVCIQGFNYHVDMYNHLMNGDHLARLAEKETFLQSTNIEESCSEDFDPGQKSGQTKSKSDITNSKMHKFGAYDEESWFSPYDFIDKPNPKETVCHICEDTPLRLYYDAMDNHVVQKCHQATLRKYGCENILTCGNKYFKCLWCDVEMVNLKDIKSHARNVNHMSRVMEARAKEDEEKRYPSKETPETSREASMTRTKQKTYSSENISGNTQTGNTKKYLSSEEVSQQDNDDNEKSESSEKSHVSAKKHRSRMKEVRPEEDEEEEEETEEEEEEEIYYESNETPKMSRDASTNGREQDICNSEMIPKQVKKGKSICYMLAVPSKHYSNFRKTSVSDRDEDKLNTEFVGFYCFICNLYISKHEADEINHYETLEHREAERKYGCCELEEKTNKHWHCICCRVCVKGSKKTKQADLHNHLISGDHLDRLAEKKKFSKSTNIEENCSKLDREDRKLHKFGAYDEESWFSPYDFISKLNKKNKTFFCYICEARTLRLCTDIDSHVTQERHQAALRKYGCENILTCGNKFFKCLWCNAGTTTLKGIRGHMRDENHISRVMEARTKENERICYASKETPETSREASMTRTKQETYSSENISGNTQTGDTRDYLSSEEVSQQDYDDNEKSESSEKNHVSAKKHRSRMKEVRPEEEEICYESNETPKMSREASTNGREQDICNSEMIPKQVEKGKSICCMLAVPSNSYSNFRKTFASDRDEDKLNTKFVGSYCFICDLYIPKHGAKEINHCRTLEHREAEREYGCCELEEKTSKHWHCMCCRVCVRGSKKTKHTKLYDHLISGDHLDRLAEKKKFSKSTNIEDNCSKFDREDRKLHKFGAYDEESWFSPYDFISKPTNKNPLCTICEATPLQLYTGIDRHVTQERHQAALRKYGCENILTCGHKFFKCLWCDAGIDSLPGIRTHVRDENHISRVMEARAKENERICYASKETPEISRESSMTRTQQQTYSSENISENTPTDDTSGYPSCEEAFEKNLNEKKNGMNTVEYVPNGKSAFYQSLVKMGETDVDGNKLDPDFTGGYCHICKVSMPRFSRKEIRKHGKTLRHRSAESRYACEEIFRMSKTVFHCECCKKTIKGPIKLYFHLRCKTHSAHAAAKQKIFESADNVMEARAKEDQRICNPSKETPKISRESSMTRTQKENYSSENISENTPTEDTNDDSSSEEASEQEAREKSHKRKPRRERIKHVNLCTTKYVLHGQKPIYQSMARRGVLDGDGNKLDPDLTGGWCYMCNVFLPRYLRKEVREHGKTLSHRSAESRYGCEQIFHKSETVFHCECCDTTIEGTLHLYYHVRGKTHLAHAAAKQKISGSANNGGQRSEDLAASQESVSPKIEPEDEKPDGSSCNEMTLLPRAKFIVTRNERQSFCQICDDNPLPIATSDIESHGAQKLHQEALKKYGCDNILTRGDDFFKCPWCDRDIFSIEDVFLHIKGKKHTTRVTEVRPKEEKEEEKCCPSKERPKMSREASMAEEKQKSRSSNNIPKNTKIDEGIDDSTSEEAPEVDFGRRKKSAQPKMKRSNTFLAHGESKFYQTLVQKLVTDCDGNELKPEHDGPYCYICNLCIPSYSKHCVTSHTETLTHKSAERKYACEEILPLPKWEFQCNLCRFIFQGKQHLYHHLQSKRHLKRALAKHPILESAGNDGSSPPQNESKNEAKKHDNGKSDEPNLLPTIRFIVTRNEKQSFCQICDEVPLPIATQDVDSHVEQVLHQEALKKYGCDNILTQGDNFFKCLWCDRDMFSIEDIFLHVKGKKHTSRVIGLPKNEVDIPENAEIDETNDDSMGDEASRQDSDDSEKIVLSGEEAIRYLCTIQMIDAETPFYRTIARTVVTDRDGVLLPLQYPGFYCFICNLCIVQENVGDHRDSSDHKSAQFRFGCDSLIHESEYSYCELCDRMKIEGERHMYYHLKSRSHLTRVAEKNANLESSDSDEEGNEVFAPSLESHWPESKMETENSEWRNMQDAYDEAILLPNSYFIVKRNAKKSFCQICEDNPLQIATKDIENHIAQERHQVAIKKYGCDNILTSGENYFKCLWCETEMSSIEEVFLHVKDKKHMSRVIKVNVEMEGCWATPAPITEEVEEVLEPRGRNLLGDYIAKQVPGLMGIEEFGLDPVGPEEWEKLDPSGGSHIDPMRFQKTKKEGKNLYDAYRNRKKEKKSNIPIPCPHCPFIAFDTMDLHAHVAQHVSDELTNTCTTNAETRIPESMPEDLFDENLSTPPETLPTVESALKKPNNKKKEQMREKFLHAELSFNDNQIYSLREKLEDLKLGLELCLTIDRDTIYCLICRTNVKNCLEDCFQHFWSLDHTNYLKMMEGDDRKFKKAGDTQFSDLKLAGEYMEEMRQLIVHCYICDQDVLNEIPNITNHIYSLRHESACERVRAGAAKNYEDMKSLLKCDWYAVQTYWCVPCRATVRSPVHFMKHLRSSKHLARVPKENQAKMIFDHCATCALLFYGYRCTHYYHTQVPMHQLLARECYYAMSDLPTRSKHLIEFVDIWLEQLMGSLERSSDTERAREQRVLQDVQRTARRKFPRAQAHLFGSRINTLAQPGSDVDVYLDCQNGGKPTKKEQKTENIAFFINGMEKCMKEEPEVWLIEETLGHCRTPIIRVYHNPSGLSCDVSFGNSLSVENSQLVRAYVINYPPCRKLILVLKQWVKNCNLAGQGGIASYVVAMLVIFYLQNEFIVPSVANLIAVKNKSKIVDGWEAGVSHNFACHPPQFDDSNTKQLLARFFAFYADFDFRNQVVCPLLGDPVPKIDFLNPTELPAAMRPYLDYLQATKKPEIFRIDSPMCVQDPFDLQCNLTRAVNKSLLNQFRGYCSRSLDLLPS